ncbi:carboxypeptidase [candidate division KSB3 bacterium]|uniref:Metal-dependent carboxypeptidase n=1 Tax=candidate division KSB3 bacterium TaxID=2044937 RepID=A0A2G6E839_9BACT|nr:MAG: carboxypeptidase [candidate division KSB3 bacterium]PIE30574.1 MAG: carboxypeptidase [candidate division KSB3 bacterium]
MKEQFEQLTTILGKVNDLQKAAAILQWDQQTYMPPAGVEARAMQLATLEQLAHHTFVSEEVGQLLENLHPLLQSEAPDSDTACLIRLATREYEKASKISPALIATLARKTALAHNAWEKAREEKDFSQFRGILSELIELLRQKAEQLGYTEHIYDALLDLYEPEMTTRDVENIFHRLKHAVLPMIQEIAQRPDALCDDVLNQAYDREVQWDFGIEVLKQIGYDFDRGRQDTAAHPFTVSFSPHDVRITTRLNPNMFASAFFSSVHEGGHALYEQGLPLALSRTLLCEGASMAVHESQSRFWENVIGRSRPFWTCFFPRLQTMFPKQLEGATVEQIYQAVNVVRPDYIRVEADELTYNLHIFIRFELETALISGAVGVKELPQLWNHKMETYLGITPPNDALGVLQDVHWSAGLFGYFPTYTLGNVLSLQFNACLRRDIPDCDEQIARGEFSRILHWLRDKIHIHGSKFPPAELVRRVTGTQIDPQAYIDYLQTKYGELYGFTLPENDLTVEKS